MSQKKVKMQALNEKEWRQFRLGDIADVYSGCDIYDADRVKGDTPYITSGSLNNGIGYFVGNNNNSKSANAISVNRNGSIGLAFYHRYPALYSNDCRRVSLKFQASPGAQLFIAQAISLQKGAFSYSRKLGTHRLLNLKVNLPTNEAGQPDLSYMESYIENGLFKKVRAYEQFLAKKLENVVYKSIQPLNECTWDYFKVDEIFSVSRPSPRSIKQYQNGDTPFVASGSVNNGILGFCTAKEEDHLDKANCITVSPVDGSAFYQPFDFLGRGGAGSSIMILRSHDVDSFSGQFIARMIRQACSKYSYGHMGNTNSIKHETVKLPAVQKHMPDFEFMEQYSINMMLKKYRQYSSFPKMD